MDGMDGISSDGFQDDVLIVAGRRQGHHGCRASAWRAGGCTADEKGPRRCPEDRTGGMSVSGMGVDGER